MGLKQQVFSFLLLAVFVRTASAFTAGKLGGAASFRVNTKLYKATKQPPVENKVKDISYGEESRKYRRTVYTHDDWVRHRSPDRFWRNLRAFTSSGVYKNLAKEVVATTSVATFVVVYNCLVGGYEDFAHNHYDPLFNSPLLPLFGLPLAPFTLSSPSLGLLLGKSIFLYIP